MGRLSIALLHHPVVDRDGEIYTTAITNIDVHDIARSARTFDLDRYYLVTPIEAQQRLGSTIAGFWIDGAGKERNRDRTRAMELVDIRANLEACIEEEGELCGTDPLLIATSAKASGEKTIDHRYAQRLIDEARSTILIFGTGYGLSPSILDLSHHLLAPIGGADGYNHLSVRSAVAIILDRLRGR